MNTGTLGLSGTFVAYESFKNEKGEWEARRIYPKLAPAFSELDALHAAITWLSENQGVIEFAEWPDTPPYVFARVLCDDGSCAGTTEPFYVKDNPIQAVIDAVAAVKKMVDTGDLIE